MGGLAQFLCDGGYERLRRATRTHRGDLIVRLCGEVGLRPKEVVTISSDDAVEIGGVWFLDVGVRKAYLPADVAHAIRKYARSIDTEETLVDVSERRIQMLVRECGNRAADTTGDDRFREISTRDLRAFHARQLVSDGVDLSVILAVTAYSRLAALEPYIDPPDQERIASTLDSKQSTVDPPSTRFRRAVTVAADVGKELTAASTSSDIHEIVCDRLAGADEYRFAWIAEATGDGLVARTHAGVERDTLERIRSESEAVIATTLDNQEIQTRNAETATLITIPLSEGQTAHGLLGIGVPPNENEIDQPELDVLTVLGTQIGHAIAAVERKRLLLADTVIELTFGVSHEAAVLPVAAATLDCSFELVGVVPVDGGLLCYVAARNVTPDAVLEYAVATDAIEDVRFVGDNNEGILFELSLHHSPILVLTEAGGRVQSYEVDPHGGRLVGEISTDVDVRDIVATLTDAFSGITLDAKRETEHEIATDMGFRETLADELTERQATVLRSAYFGGYFEWPRDSTGEELADSLDVSSPTLHHHLRTAQQKLLRTFFDDL